MSATNRGAIVIEQEFYPTPDYTIDSILKEIDFTAVASFREPCKGAGAIYNKVKVANKDYCELSEGTDYLKTVLPRTDLIITNPPFSLAKEFIIKARSESDCVIMLQRLNYLGSRARKSFWNNNPPTHIFVLSTRPKFIAKCSNKKKNLKGVRICRDPNNYQITTPRQRCLTCNSVTNPSSDATEYAWFVWDSSNKLHKSPGVYVI